VSELMMVGSKSNDKLPLF